jgi:hypothetical protein
VLVELLRQGPPLRSEDPEEIMRLFIRLGEVYDLGLVVNRIFMMRILPLVTGSLLRFVGDCLGGGGSWADCKTCLLEEYFLYFVRERLTRDLIVFNFQREGQPLRRYIEQIFQTAGFLRYNVTESQLVDRVSGVPRNFVRGGGSTNSVEDRGQRERGSGSSGPLVRGYGGNCNLLREISFHIVKFS